MIIVVDHPQCQSHSLQHGRAQSRRPSGLISVARDNHVGIVFLNFKAGRPCRCETACEPGVPRYSAVRPPDPRKARVFLGFKGAQSYRSRTKDIDDVDFSMGSVGLGVAQTLFSSLVQDYVSAHGWMEGRREGRMIALVGDAGDG